MAVSKVMERTAGFLLVMLVTGVGLVGCGTTDSPNQTASGPTDTTSQAGDTVSEQIALDGIAELEWGSDTDAVVDRYGEPDRTKHPRGKDAVLSYVYENSEFHGYPVRRIFYFGRDDGLILVSTQASFEPEQDCEALFEKFESVIRQANPGIEPETYRENESDGPFCQAVRDGEARWEQGWLLPDSASMGVLSITPGQPTVKMVLVSSTFGKYMKRRRQHR